MVLDRLPAVRRHRAPWAAAASLLALASLADPAGAAAFQAGGEEWVTPERLQFEKKCFFDIPEWAGKGEERFVERLESHRKHFAETPKDADKLPGVEELLGECLWARKLRYEKDDDEVNTSAYCGKILELKSSGGKLAEYKKGAQDYLVLKQLAKAKEAYRVGNLDDARAKYQNFLGMTDRPDVRTEAINVIVDIERQQNEFEKVVGAQDLERESQVLGTILANLKGHLGDAYADAAKSGHVESMEKRKIYIDNSTQDIEFRLLDVAAAVGGVKLGRPAALDLKSAAFALVPVVKGQGEPFAKGALPKSKFRWPRGTYDVTVYLAAPKERPVAVLLQVVLADKPAAVEVPNLIPDGMVYAGPWSGGGGFFVDVTEVTVAQVKAVAGDDQVLNQVLKDSNTGDDDPAWFEEEAAEAFERATGKSIPSVQQWLAAAFGPYSASQRLYPWGPEPPSAERVYSEPSKTEPQPVGGRTAGRSPFQALDMAGNMAEWVRSESELHLIGGHYRMTPEELTSFKGRNPLRETLPGPRAYEKEADAMSPEQREVFSKLKIDAKQVYVTGLRMVVPVK